MPLELPRFVSFSSLLALAAAAAMAAPPAWAGRPVPVYDVTVRGSASPSTLQDAMREALVRATGRQDAATDPAFAALVAHASDYVEASRPAGDGATEVTFDGASIGRQITSAGRSVWDADRPFTIVVLSPPPTGAADDETRRALEEIAERRGLPVSLVPMPVADASGNPLSADALLTSARRLGGDAVLLGRSEAASPGAPGPASGPSGAAASAPSSAASPAPADAAPLSGQWQWTLVTGLATQSWNGPFDAGVNGAADALARVEGSTLPLTEQEAVVQVSGVGSLADYAAVERTLGELPGVSRSGLVEADGATATFHVLIRGGAQAIERALANAQHLTRVGGAQAVPPGQPAAAQPNEPAQPSGPAQAGSAQPGSAQPGTAQPLAYQYHP